MRSAVHACRVMLFLNGVALASFLAAGSRHWMTEEAAYGSSLDEIHAGMAWELNGFLIVVAAVLANVIWLARGLRTGARPRHVIRAIFAILVLAGWIAALVFDGGHNGARVR